MKIKKLLLFSYALSFLTITLLTFKMVGMWFDAHYVASLHLPSDADSVGIPLFENTLLGIFAFSATTVMYAVLLILLVAKKRMAANITLADASLKIKEGRITKTTIVVLTIACLPMLYFPPFYLFVNLLFLATDIVAFASGIVTALSLCMLIGGLTKKHPK